MAQALGCKEKACISLARARPGSRSALPRGGPYRVLHFHGDAPLPQGLQHLGLQPFGPVSGAHHHNL